MLQLIIKEHKFSLKAQLIWYATILFSYKFLQKKNYEEKILFYVTAIEI